MTAPPRTLDPLRRASALGVLLTGVVGVPVGLWRLSGAHLPEQVPSWAQVSAALSGPDTGALFLGLLVVVGWAAWAVFAVSVAAELATQLRGLPPLRLPGLAAPQQMAGLLVAAVVGVGGAPLLAAPALAGPPVTAEQPNPEPSPAPAPAPPPSGPVTSPPAAAGPAYTVQPRDTLGRIAARQLGDWTRFDEILELNRGRTQPDGGALSDPALVRPGWVLILPPDASGRVDAARPPAAAVVVQPGETLTDIAERHGINSWQPIFEANAGEPQPGGGRFTDPDLIRPGQVLDLPPAGTPTTAPTLPPEPEPEPEPPTPAPPDAAEPTTPEPTTAGPTTAGPTTAPDPLPTSPAPPRTAPHPGPPGAGATVPTEATDAQGPGAARTGTEDDQASPELAAVLGGSGALLAAGVGAVWLSHHRQRVRRRRTGRRLAVPPAEVTTTQAAVSSAADTGHPDYAALDRALRSLAVLISRDPDARLPDIVAARLDGHRLALRLHTPADRPPPPPWTAEDAGYWWCLQLHEGPDPTGDEVARGRLAPYPTLVTIGSNGARRWLLDLERVGVLQVTGPAGRRADFIRHLAAELAVNSWSDLLTVTTVGFGRELVDLAPDRVHPVDDPSDAALRTVLGDVAERDGDVLAGRLQAGPGPGWMPHVVLAPQPPDGDDALAQVAGTPRGRAARTRLAVVLGAEPTQKPDDWQVVLTEDGALHVPALDLRLPAPQLSEQHARDVATLLAFERDTADEAIPAADGDRPWQVLTDAAGALRPAAPPPEEHEPPTHTRPVLARSPVEAAPDAPPAQVPSGTAPTGPPGADPWAGTPIDAAAVSSATDVRSWVEADLEPLDRDLADWWNPDCARPRLTLLGPVALRARGNEQAVTKSGSRRRYEEAVAYLATRPHGATVDEAATALQPARGGRTDPVSARAYVHRITAGARAWLGTDPATGEKHLSSGHRGPYTLTNVLVDADLFRQLRARAGVRGRDGIPDLVAALELVAGPPFAQRPTGYEWLGGLDLTLTAAICDVAHEVVTVALDEDDVDTARTACSTALRVAPDDEKVLLDAVRVAYREGNRAEAETHIARLVDVHDGEDEMDLPLSTAEVVNRARQQYLDRASSTGH